MGALPKGEWEPWKEALEGGPGGGPEGMSWRTALERGFGGRPWREALKGGHGGSA